jgi:peroxiredoxin
VAILGVVVVVWLTGRPTGGGSGQAAGGVRAVGQLAPPVRLPSTTGQTIDLAGFRGKRNVLLYFYEHAGWSPCEAQLVELQRTKATFQVEGTEVFAVTVQDLATSRAMAERLSVDVPILSDASTQVARSFGIYDLPGSMGPFSTHSFWLIDRQGRIRFREVSLEMHVPFRKVEQAVAGLKA